MKIEFQVTKIYDSHFFFPYGYRMGGRGGSAISILDRKDSASHSCLNIKPIKSQIRILLLLFCNSMVTYPNFLPD